MHRTIGLATKLEESQLQEALLINTPSGEAFRHGRDFPPQQIPHSHKKCIFPCVGLVDSKRRRP